MGVRTSVVKRIVRKPTVSWRTRRHADRYLVVATSKDFPTIAVVYAPDQFVPRVVTVLWKTQERYDRATYEPTGERTS